MAYTGTPKTLAVHFTDGTENLDRLLRRRAKLVAELEAGDRAIAMREYALQRLRGEQ